MTSGYDALGKVYDRLNKDVDYSGIADFIEACYGRFFDAPPSSILDLGCGTGSLTLEFASRGYDMTALDISPDMLSAAYKSASDKGINDILFIEGDMCDFELYGSVDSVICTMDGINHITKKDRLSSCFGLVHKYIQNGGIFIFDVNSPYKFKNVYADNVYALEEDGAVCIWQNSLSAKGDMCRFYLTVFEEQSDGRYTRTDGVQCERCYSLKTLEKLLVGAGFEILGLYGGTGFEEITETTERYYIVSRAKKK